MAQVREGIEMKQFYKVRVVVDHKDGSCVVQTKDKWFSQWKFYQVYPTGVHIGREDAKKYAMDCADRISASRVIYEVP